MAESASHGVSGTPPFYSIDMVANRISVRPPLSEQDWDTIIGVMRELRLARLETGGQLTDSALERVSELDFVTDLDLGDCRWLTDRGFQPLDRMPQLAGLVMNGRDNPIGDPGLTVLRQLRELRRFTMTWAPRVTDAGAAQLADCDLLESVDLMGTATGDGVIRALADKGRLAHLKTGTQVSDAGLSLLGQVPAFKRWQGGAIRYSLTSPDAGPTHLLIDGPFTDRGLATLGALEGLFGLSIFWHSPAFTDEGFKQLAKLPRLGLLGCPGDRTTDLALRHIAALPQLRILVAQGAVAGDEGFAALSRSPTLEYLWGRECPNLTGRGFLALSTMPSLKGLGVSLKQVDQDALAALPRFPGLRELMPMDLTDAGFRHVGGMDRLETLWCMYCRETGDAATEAIAQLRLKGYYAGLTRITDRSLAILGRMASLEQLDFQHVAGITDAGIALLTRLPALREITVAGSAGVTRQAVAGFPARVRAHYWP